MSKTQESIDFESRLGELSLAISRADAGAAVVLLEETDGEGTARLIDRLETSQQAKLMELLSPEQAVEILEHVQDFQGAGIIGTLSPETAAPVVAKLDSDDRADLLNEMSRDEAEAILEALPPEQAEETRRFMAYPAGTAGTIMYNEFVSFDADMTVEAILQDIQHRREDYVKYGVQYAYVLGQHGTLMGVLTVSNLLFARPSQTAGEIMIPEPITVEAETSISELEHIFDQHHFLGLPVVDNKNRLIGIIDRAGRFSPDYFRYVRLFWQSGRGGIDA